MVTEKKRTTYTRREIFAELLSTVRAGNDPGAVEDLRDHLLAEGGDVNYARQNDDRLKKRIRGVDQTDQRSDLLAIATTAGNLDVV